MTSSRIARDRWLTSGVVGIGGASFLADVGHEVPTSLLPSFLTTTLGASGAALGLIEGVADGCAGVARFTGGALADDPERRRRSAVGGYTATAVFSSLIGATTGVWQVGILRAAAWSARGLRVPARNALLADVVPKDAYGHAYGFERMMDNLGAIGGPLLASLLVALIGVRSAMLVSVIPGLLATIAILYAIRVTRHATRQARKPIRFTLRPVLKGQLGRLFIGIGAVAFAASFIGLALTGAQIVVLALCFAAAGVGIAFAETAENHAVATHAMLEIRGSAFGALATLQSLGNFAASTIAGLLFTVVSPRAAFLYLAAWMIAALIAFVGVTVQDRLRGDGRSSE